MFSGKETQTMSSRPALTEEVNKALTEELRKAIAEQNWSRLASVMTLIRGSQVSISAM